MFNEEQISYMKELSSISPKDLCYCGWYKKGKCPNCPPNLSCLDKLNVSCKSCGNYPHFSKLNEPIRHNIICKIIKENCKNE